MAFTPSNYLLFNEQDTKRPIVVVKIDGVADLFSSAPVYTRVRYGDPNIFYGDPGLVYGGLRRIEGVRDYLTLEGSNFSITQTIEPERGKGTVSQLSLNFVDIDQYMTRLCAPGVIVDEILGREVQVFLGYEEVSYPEDYFRVFRGYVSQVQPQAGRVTFSLSDPNVRRRQQLFYQAKTKLTSAITDTQTSITVDSAGDFHKQILGPDGNYLAGINTYLKIGDEFIGYPAGQPVGNTFGSVTRGARGTTAVAADAGTDVDAWVEIEDHGVDMALRLMLSGWGGNWLSDVPVLSFVQTFDISLGLVPGAIVLPPGIDAQLEYGLTVGDYVTVSGATVGANNVTLKTIVRFIDLDDQANRIIVIDDPLAVEEPTTATLAFRSKHDVYPNFCGLKLTPKDVSVSRHEYYKNTFLLGDEYRMRFLLSSPAPGKDFLESQVYLGLGGYSITQRGQLSMGLTKPPIADQRLVILNKDSVMDPASLAPMRTISGRFFYNEITYNYDYSDDGEATQILTNLDSESLSLIGQSSPLPISSRGIRSDLTPTQNLERRSNFLLTRFKRGATVIKVKVKYAEANQIEIGDVVGIEDRGGLQIANFNTGSRDLGVQLFEVQQRVFNIQAGMAELMLVAGVGSEATDRFATIGPSSVLGAGSTTSSLIITDSFDTATPGDEPSKWVTYIGYQVRIHNDDFTFDETRIFTGFSATNRNEMLLDAVLPSAPPAGYIVDQPEFPSNSDPTDQDIWKLIHAFWSPTVDVVSGASQLAFDVSALDAPKFFAGSRVVVSSQDFTTISPEVTVVSVGPTTITVDAALGFTPSAGMIVRGIGFPDLSATYRWI